MSESVPDDSASPSVRPPEPLCGNHELSAFDSGEASLNDWLRRRALPNEARGASRTYVVCEHPGNRVVGYYCLAAGAATHDLAPGSVRRNMSDPVPIIVIGRLAVDRARQAEGIGRALLRDAIFRTLQAAEIAGVRAILVHALSEDARQFYLRCGFHPSPIDPMTLMISLAEAERPMSVK